MIVRHLLGGCVRCRRLARRVWEGEPVPPEIDLDALAMEVWQRGEAFRREQAAAPALLAELDRLSPSRRLLLVANSTRFRTRALCELLADGAREACATDVGAALDKARLAIALAERLPAEIYGAGAVDDSRARAWSVLGHAQREASELRQAEASFRRADELLETGSGDPIEVGRVRYLAAFLRHAQGRFQEALALFREAARQFRTAGDEHLVGSTLIDRGRTLRELGELEQAVVSVRAGLERIDPARSPRMELVGKHNLTLFLQEQGQAEEALRLVGDLLPLHTKLGGELDKLRLRWLEGKLAHLQGDLDRARAAFEQVRQAFVDREMPYDAALVSLDLAAVHLVEERFDRVGELATETLALFRALEIDREAIAALCLLEEATRARRASLALLAELGGYLKRIQRQPGLAFRPAVT